MKDTNAVDTEKLSACTLKDYLRLCVSRNPNLETAYATAIWHMSLLCKEDLVVIPTHTSRYKEMMNDLRPNPIQFSGSTFFTTDNLHNKLLANYQQCLNKQQGNNNQRCAQVLEAAENAELGYNTSCK